MAGAHRDFSRNCWRLRRAAADVFTRYSGQWGSRGRIRKPEGDPREPWILGSLLLLQGAGRPAREAGGLHSCSTNWGTLYGDGC